MIPKELTELNQWVCAWDGSKCPMKAYEKRAASSVDPSTWSDYETACEAVTAGHYDYLGFVFADNGIVGIDIDTGFDPDSGLMTPLCADIMAACHSYTEKSRSGRGVHIFLRGTLPFHGKNNLQGVEIYQSRRFFIMTGQTLIFPEIIENQEAIDYVVETYFPETERTADGGNKTVGKIYNPVWVMDKKSGKIPVQPIFPDIEQGGRNISLASLAGCLHNVGYSKREIYMLLCKVNSEKCKPPLSDREVMNITDSITKYERR